MKFKIFLVLALMLAATATTYHVYEADQVVVSKYTVQQRPDGSMAVFPTGRPILPKYIIKDNKIYQPNQILIPKYYLKDGEVVK